MGKNVSTKTVGISSDAVKARTGKGWAEWFAVLDKAAGRQMPHREIAILLNQKHGLSGWWAQMVTVGYEQARGLRAKHEKPEGYEISVSRTIAAPARSAFRAWNDAALRRRWLDRPVEIRKATPGKSLRITWADRKTSLSVNLYAKGAGKCQVVVQHSKLPDAKAAERMKSEWARRLDRLQSLVEA